jgi:hypothetical protein
MLMVRHMPTQSRNFLAQSRFLQSHANFLRISQKFLAQTCTLLAKTQISLKFLAFVLVNTATFYPRELAKIRFVVVVVCIISLSSRG